MLERDDWRERAREHNGRLVVWINQMRAPNMKAANSQGVCRTITVEWISGCRRYRADRSAFVNKFRKYDANGRMDGIIPDQYIEDQELYTLGLTLEVQEYKEAKAKYDKTKAQKDFELLDKIARRAFGGPDCVKFSVFKSVDGILQRFSKVAVPSYFGLGLIQPKLGGHMIGLEFRPDQNISLSFPRLYQFFDANCGLFAFGDLREMLDFVKQKVWPRQSDNGQVVWRGYEDYPTIFLLEYDVGKGGFG